MYPELGQSGPVCLASSASRALLIAHAPSDIAALLDALDAMQAQRDAARAEAARLRAALALIAKPSTRYPKTRAEMALRENAL